MLHKWASHFQVWENSGEFKKHWFYSVNACFCHLWTRPALLMTYFSLNVPEIQESGKKTCDEMNLAWEFLFLWMEPTPLVPKYAPPPLRSLSLPERVSLARVVAQSAVLSAAAPCYLILALSLLGRKARLFPTLEGHVVPRMNRDPEVPPPPPPLKRHPRHAHSEHKNKNDLSSSQIFFKAIVSHKPTFVCATSGVRARTDTKCLVRPRLVLALGAARGWVCHDPLRVRLWTKRRCVYQHTAIEQRYGCKNRTRIDLSLCELFPSGSLGPTAQNVIKKRKMGINYSKFRWWRTNNM